METDTFRQCSLFSAGNPPTYSNVVYDKEGKPVTTTALPNHPVSKRKVSWRHNKCPNCKTGAASTKRKHDDSAEDSKLPIFNEILLQLHEQRATQQTIMAQLQDLTNFSSSANCRRHGNVHDDDEHSLAQHHVLKFQGERRDDGTHQLSLPPTSSPEALPQKPLTMPPTKERLPPTHAVPSGKYAQHARYQPSAEHMFHAVNSLDFQQRSRPQLTLKSTPLKKYASASSSGATFREQLKDLKTSSTSTRPSVVLASDRGWTLNISAPLGSGSYADVWKGSIHYDEGWARDVEEVAIKRLTRDNPAPGEISKEYLFSAYLCQLYGKKTPVCEPKFLLDRVDITNIFESILVMEIASCSLSSYIHAHFEGVPARHNEARDANLQSIYLALIEAVLFVNAAGVHHRDLHTGNVLLRVRDRDGNLCHGTHHIVSLDDRSSTFDVLISDFGMSEFFSESAPVNIVDITVLLRGAEAYMAPDCFQNNDGWSVLFIGYLLAGVNPPWNLKGKGSRTVLPFEVDLIKMRCLFGEHWQCTVSNLKAIISDEESKEMSQWRRNAQRDANLWFEAFELDSLFKALLEAEVQFLQTGKLVPWTEPASRWRNKVLRNGI